MKIAQVPNKAFDTKPVSIPTKVKVVPDWEQFYAMVEKEGFVIVECADDEIRPTPAGAEEAAPVKAFNTWVRYTLGKHIKTKRIGANRWFVTL
jgi:hypothetical protein